MDKDTGASGGVEIRIHGIGNHDLWSALGSPTIIKKGVKRGATLALPPEEVDHRLILVNWSRMSRRAPAVIWYLAFPFTLINVAFAMAPAKGWRRTVHLAAVAAAGLVLTLIAACWTFAFFEIFYSLTNLPDQWQGARHELTVGTGASVLILLMLFRAIHAESSAHRVFAALHAGVVAAVGACALLIRPSDWQVGEDSWWRFFAVQGPTDAQLTSPGFPGNVDLAELPYWFDPLGTISFACLALCAVLAVLLLTTWVKRVPGPASGSAFAVLLSGALITLITSSAHLGLTQILAKVQLPFFGGQDSYLPSNAVVMARFGRSYPTTLLALVSLVLVLILALTAVYAAGNLKALSWMWAKRHRARFLRWSHGAVGQLPTSLAAATGLTILCFLPLGIALDRLFNEREYATLFCSPSPSSPGSCLPVIYSVIGWAATGSALVAFYVVRKAGSLPALRNTLAGIADVSGFWPITQHPLGARTYRPDAVQGIADALDEAGTERTVLVGHSQGSVLAAWAVVHPHRESPSPEIVLVTCGSPLTSLYATFFPATFGGDFFAEAAAKTARWGNFWRETDPIGTELQYPEVENISIPDPEAEDLPVRGHSDYWIADKQTKWITDRLPGEY